MVLNGRWSLTWGIFILKKNIIIVPLIARHKIEGCVKWTGL